MRGRTAAVVITLFVVASAGILALRSASRGTGEVGESRWAPGGVLQYPDEWRTTLDTAMANARFGLILPNHPKANSGNVTAVYLWPDRSTVALQFPPLAVAASPVRQDYIEVWESPWTGGDPNADFAADMAAAPAVGKALYDIDGIPALGVTAHSPSDMDEANPAFLRFVFQGIEVEISGGEDVNMLIEIAKSIVTQTA